MPVDAIVAGAGLWGCTIARRLAEASGKTVAEATIIRCDATRMDFRFDASLAPDPYQIVLRRMNEDGKSYTLARLKVEVVSA